MEDTLGISAEQTSDGSRTPSRGMVTLVVALILALAGPATGQDAQQPPADTAEQADSAAVARTGAPAAWPVVIRGDTVMVLSQPLGPFSAADRAAAIRERVRRLARSGSARADSVHVVDRADATDIQIGDSVIASVTDADADALAADRLELAGRYAARIHDALEAESWISILRALAVGAGLTLLAVLVFWALIRALSRIFPRIYRLIGFWRSTRIPSLRIQKLEIVSSERIADVLIWLAKVLHVVLVILLLYFFVPLVLSFFPWTQDLSSRLLDYVVQPFGRALRGIVDYLPNLLTIAVVVVITRYLLVLIHFVFRGVERKAISFPGFFPDWAEPTYKIVRFVVLVFALILIWDNLPGSDSDAFAGVSVFVGLLISLGSASAIANVVAGVVITYMRPFRLGDRVKISDTVGDVVEKSLLVTRIRTIKNVDVTVPNAMVLGSHIVNYSSSAGERGVIMHTSVTIGYDVPWRAVHEALIAAADDTPDIREEPEPFVHQTALGDFAVAYELNAYTDAPGRMAAIYSALHQNIQDRFADAGIEIMSPAYTALRDGNQVAIPADQLPDDYRAPSFRIRSVQPQEDDAG